MIFFFFARTKLKFIDMRKVHDSEQRKLPTNTFLLIFCSFRPLTLYPFFGFCTYTLLQLLVILIVMDLKS